MMKTCSKCKVDKPAHSFAKRSRAHDGLTPHCKACTREYNQQRYAANAANERERAQLWREENPEYGCDYRKGNRAGERKRLRRWRNLLPDKARAHEQKYRARKAAAALGDPAALQARIAEIYVSPCAHCGAAENIHVDHIWPISKGGAHATWNLQPLCGSCNSAKGNKVPLLLEASN